MSTPVKQVITRFAPSPTGFLHIGGARTALFNWLYARHCGGRFLLRIEDTDFVRSTKDAIEAIFSGLSWLGLEADDEVVFQSRQQARHADIALQLLASGGAYTCFMSPEETQIAREAALVKGQALRSPWRDREPSPEQLKTPHVVRFKGPLDQALVIKDAVQGDVTFNTRTFDDLILLRSDGSPTYNLAVVVDDRDMGITHVIRGDDHLNNAARQALIYQALGWDLPVFAHIPLIHGPDGAKLSKRHGAQAIGDYQQLGYLPQAMRNYLARLGWSHGNDEIFTDAQAMAWFDIADINRAPSRLDFAKLGHVNAHWLRKAEPARLIELVSGYINPTPDQATLERSLPLIIERAQTLPQLAQALAFTQSPPPPIDEKGCASLGEDTKARLLRLTAVLENETDWSVDTLDKLLKLFAKNEGIGFGKLGPTLRLVLTRGLVAPDIAKILACLGPQESLKRVKDTLLI
jgi:glutamyl-tRNA synthetase